MREIPVSTFSTSGFDLRNNNYTFNMSAAAVLLKCNHRQ